MKSQNAINPFFSVSSADLFRWLKDHALCSIERHAFTEELKRRDLSPEMCDVSFFVGYSTARIHQMLKHAQSKVEKWTICRELQRRHQPIQHPGHPWSRHSKEFEAYPYAT